MFALARIFCQMLGPNPETCAAYLIDRDYPPNLWYTCALGPHHEGPHRAIGATPEWLWRQDPVELHEIDWVLG